MCCNLSGEDVSRGLPAGELLQHQDQPQHPRHPPGPAAAAIL